MQTFSYVIQDALGIHARPAGKLVKCAGAFESDIMLACGKKEADAKRLFSVMCLGAHQGDVLHFTIRGADEQAASEALTAFCHQTL